MLGHLQRHVCEAECLECLGAAYREHITYLYNAMYSRYILGLGKYFTVCFPTILRLSTRVMPPAYENVKLKYTVKA